MALFLIFYLVVGILLAWENYLTDIEEGYESSLNIYKWMPITWFFILVYNVFFRDRNNTGLE